MTRTDIIQTLINKIDAKSYLEIGVGSGINFKTINCNNKTSVDPYPYVPVDYSLTSDAFFNQNIETFDVIFIDGLHWAEQVYRDIKISLLILNPGGYIICHDMNPHTEVMQLYPQKIPESEWTGDCWKAWVKIKSEDDSLDMVVVNTDYGCGIIRRGRQEIIEVKNELTWDYLNSDRNRLLNLVSVEYFNKFIRDEA